MCTVCTVGETRKLDVILAEGEGGKAGREGGRVYIGLRKEGAKYGR